MDMGTCNGPSRNTITGKQTLDPPRNSLDSFAQVLVMTLRDGMGVPRVYQANPHHHKVTNNFVWMQHGYGNMTPTIIIVAQHSLHPPDNSPDLAKMWKHIRGWNGCREDVSVQPITPQAYKTLCMDVTCIWNNVPDHLGTLLRISTP